MADEPSFPEEASVGGSGLGAGASTGSSPEPAGEDETPSVSEAAQAAAAAKASNPNRTKHLVTGAAIGIGSAALVAALLYASRSRKSEKRED